MKDTERPPLPERLHDDDVLNHLLLARESLYRDVAVSGGLHQTNNPQQIDNFRMTLAALITERQNELGIEPEY